MPAGMMPAAITAATASPPFSMSSNDAMITCCFSGFGTSFTVASVITSSIPSQPTTSDSRS